MKNLKNIPLFPLNTVLFPGQLLPLHIFEPRYRAMIHECLANDLTFGVVLIRKGTEVGETAQPFEVGTTARIKEVEQLPDGRFDILCVGEERFRVHRLSFEQAFLSGEVEIMSWTLPQTTVSSSLIETLHSQLGAYLKILARLTKSSAEIEELPMEPYQLTCLAGIALQIPNREKQSILTIDRLEDTVQRCIDLLAHENLALKTMAAIPDPALNTPSAYFPN